MASGRLGAVSRLLLASDGTVTTMLEQISGERIVTALLDQSMAPVDQQTATLLSFPVTGLVTRTANLTGTVTGRVYVRAKTVFRPGAIPGVLRAELLGTEEPIGRLLRRNRVECFREMVSVEVPDHPLPLEPRRKYLIFIGGTPALLIEESFTTSCVESCLTAR